ncbi:GNAT family N-acetyltransferase [Nocardia donostiensis]|uniref:N-acetyltransferase domain-containing protein n=1 Tax=Nocardia donostiensis TaxID=1538463 RepID=A0A1V2TIG1_9NOCA|nr:GNAT family N-acetyltransferase [Nocardia donostiensis]ONM49317.1 hypothetical protein B0T46_08030 [Nocardia donostiensis]OQS14837.1 hypothetical protein B0T36_12290 [Nocardia donostiensis]OQS21840.1 hypothetical protein B0T44_06985 [Nocardia donostiensis]
MLNRSWRVEHATPRHAHAIAACHITCWREAYQGLVPDHVLAAFDIERRAQQWQRTLRTNPARTLLALEGSEVIGFVRAEPSRDRPPLAEIELSALYVRAPWYGTGLAHELLRAALDPPTGASPAETGPSRLAADVSCSLWVFQDNPRARAFYRKHGFAPDGASRIDYFTGVTEVRMLRPARTIGSSA